MRLSKRHREIVLLLADGMTNKEIGKKLFLSPETIKTHIKEIFKITGQKSCKSIWKIIFDEKYFGPYVFSAKNLIQSNVNEDITNEVKA